MRTILIDKVECGKELGGITAKQVLRFVRKEGLPCVYLTRRTLRFDLNTVRKWAEIRPILGKTEQMRKGEEKRKETVKAKKQKAEALKAKALKA
jgi:hypothetical protein